MHILCNTRRAKIQKPVPFVSKSDHHNHACRLQDCSLAPKGPDSAKLPTAPCSLLPTTSQCPASWSRHTSSSACIPLFQCGPNIPELPVVLPVIPSCVICTRSIVCMCCQAFHYDVTVSSMRRTDPEKEMENLDISDKERAPRGPEKPLTSELSR